MEAAAPRCVCLLPLDEMTGRTQFRAIGHGRNSAQKRRSAMRVVYTVEQKKRSSLQEVEVACGHDRAARIPLPPWLACSYESTPLCAIPSQPERPNSNAKPLNGAIRPLNPWIHLGWAQSCPSFHLAGTSAMPLLIDRHWLHHPTPTTPREVIELLQRQLCEPSVSSDAAILICSIASIISCRSRTLNFW